MPRAGALSGDRRPSSVCLMSRTSALTGKPKGHNITEHKVDFYRTKSKTSKTMSWITVIK